MDFGLSGKALVILQEALQRRGITSEALISLSLRVIEKSFIDIEEGEFHVKLLISGNDDSIIEDIINL